MTIFLAAIPPDRLAAVRDAFRNVPQSNSPLETFGWVTIAAALLALMLGLLWLNRVYQARRLRSQSLRVFQRLAGELDITSTDQWLLVRIARQQALPSPLTLLLSGATLRHHASQYSRAIRRGRRGVLHRVARLRRRIFLTAA